MPYKNKEDKNKRAKQYYLENKDRINGKARKFYRNNRKRIITRSKKYYKNNVEKTKERIKKWVENNLERRRGYQRKYINKNRKTNLKFNLNDRTSIAIWRSIRGNKKCGHWETLVGYDVNKLKKHLQKTIPRSYTWHDYLDGRLHIDHIIPISAFNFTKPEHIDFKRCWALKNLQLLPAKKNQSKGGKLTRPFQPALRI